MKSIIRLLLIFFSIVCSQNLVAESGLGLSLEKAQEIKSYIAAAQALKFSDEEIKAAFVKALENIDANDTVTLSLNDEYKKYALIATGITATALVVALALYGYNEGWFSKAVEPNQQNAPADQDPQQGPNPVAEQPVQQPDPEIDPKLAHETRPDVIPALVADPDVHAVVAPAQELNLVAEQPAQQQVPEIPVVNPAPILLVNAPVDPVMNQGAPIAPVNAPVQAPVAPAPDFDPEFDPEFDPVLPVNEAVLPVNDPVLPVNDPVLPVVNRVVNSVISSPPNRRKSSAPAKNRFNSPARKGTRKNPPRNGRSAGVNTFGYGRVNVDGNGKRK